MKPRRPSAAMVVALIALVLAMCGTGVAAIDYARNAGAVDGKSAVSARASLRKSAGKLVATATGGPQKGRIPGKFLSDVVRGGAAPIAKLLQVEDNQPGAPAPLAVIPGLGTLSATCGDAEPAAGSERADTTILFQPSVQPGVNFKISVGTQERPARTGFLPVSPAPVPVSGGGAFELLFERQGRNALINGATRVENAGTPNATCLVFGVALRLTQRR